MIAMKSRPSLFFHLMYLGDWRSGVEFVIKSFTAAKGKPVCIRFDRRRSALLI